VIEENNIEELELPNHFFLSKKLDVDPTLLEVKKEDIFRIMGVSEPVIDKYVYELIEKYIIECKSIVTPEVAYTIIKNPRFSSDKRTLILDQVNFNVERMVYSALKNSSNMAVFISTCGSKVEQLSKQLMKNGNSLEGYIVDLIGSEIAELIANYAHETIAKQAGEFQLNVTNRYSPGYCNWPVSDQKKLFSLLKNNTCGIQLTPTSLMIPLKSVSGMIGIGRNVKITAYKCKLCSDENCILRKINEI
jgi:hypothetical protein